MSNVKNFEEAVSRLKPFLPEYLAEKLGVDPTNTFNCLFPDHEDSTPSASIAGLDTDSPRVHCFGCGKSMDIFDAVAILEKKPRVGPEWVDGTLKYLCEKYDVDIEIGSMTPEQVYELDTYRAYRLAAALITSVDLTDKKYKTFNDAATKRGWNPEKMEENGVGTVTSFSDFSKALRSNGFTAKFLGEIDLGRKDIFTPENMIFTWRDENGRPIGFTSRDLNFEEKKAAGDKKAIKYNNQRNTLGERDKKRRVTGMKCNIFKKGSRLYGIDLAKKDTPPLYLFEGQADVITARHHGLSNCAAIAGGAVTDDHVLLLKKLGIYDIIICFDGDHAGKEKILGKNARGEETGALVKFAGHRDLNVRIMEMPEGQDPDSQINEQGIEAFKANGTWSAFQYRLNLFDEDAEPESICATVIPFIVNEKSAVVREKLVRQLANRTGMSFRAISEDLSALLDKKARERSRIRDEIIGRMKFEIGKNPIDAEQIMMHAKAELQEFDRQFNSDAMSSEGFMKDIQEQKKEQEDNDGTDSSFDLGPDMGALREWLRGEWRDTFMVFGGKPNVGKSSFLCKLAYEILANNDDAIVIFHTIDDTLAQLLPRFVCIAEASHEIAINHVRAPKYWKEHIPNLEARRSVGYQAVTDLAREGRLIIKDVTHGSSLAFAENLIAYHQERNPDKRVVYFLDNFHKLADFPNKDERVRIKQLSSAVKDLATRLHIPVLSTVEYTKIAPGIKPTKNNIAESVQIEYDTNFIAHLYSEVTDVPESFSVCHHSVDWKGEPVVLPRVEVLIDKNKITEQKGTLFYDFWPPSSDYCAVPQHQVASDAKNYQRTSSSSMANDDGWGAK